jgi:DNA-binding IclR family transcriptional regulator
MGVRKDTAKDLIEAAVLSWGAGHRFGMSFRDLALVTNLPLGTCHELARELREEGRIDFDDHVARSLRMP